MLENLQLLFFFDEKKYLRDIRTVSNIDFQSEIKNCAWQVHKDKI